MEKKFNGLNAINKLHIKYVLIFAGFILEKTKRIIDHNSFVSQLLTLMILS